MPDFLIRPTLNVVNQSGNIARLLWIKLCTPLSTRYPRFRGFCSRKIQKCYFIILRIDVPNRASVVIKGMGRNASQSGWQFLESYRYVKLSKHCRNSSVRAVRLCEKCGEIVSRRMEHSIGSQSPKTQKASRKGGLLLPCARTRIVHVFQASSALIHTSISRQSN